MKNYVVVERKHGVSLHIEDVDAMKRDTINFTWPEWCGLVWAIEDTKKNPAFKLMEPKEVVHKWGKNPEQKHEFVKHVELIDPD